MRGQHKDTVHKQYKVQTDHSQDYQYQNSFFPRTVKEQNSTPDSFTVSLRDIRLQIVWAACIPLPPCVMLGQSLSARIGQDKTPTSLCRCIHTYSLHLIKLDMIVVTMSISRNNVYIVFFISCEWQSVCSMALCNTASARRPRGDDAGSACAAARCDTGFTGLNVWVQIFTFHFAG